MCISMLKMSFYDAIRVGASGASDYEIERSFSLMMMIMHLSRTPSSASNRKLGLLVQKVI